MILIIFLFGCSNSKDTLCIGDSLFSGFNLSNNSSVVQIVNKEFDYRIIDSCVLGYTANVCVKQLNKFDLSNISFAIIELGANDFLLRKTAKATKENLLTIINYLQEKKIKVCLVSFIDSSMFLTIDELQNNEMLVEYHEAFEFFENNNILVISNIWNGRFYDDTLKIDDYHPNEKGAEIIASKIITELKTKNFFDKKH
ncbi:MAG: hypothetical protein IJD23_04445 [Spirochaetaceae bacterium]|nr:hypothetical protein [Spirochaetaceae bacterium]